MRLCTTRIKRLLQQALSLICLTTVVKGPGAGLPRLTRSTEVGSILEANLARQYIRVCEDFNVSFRCAVPWFGLGRKGGVACWPRMLGRLLGNRLLTKQTFTPCHTGAAQWRRGHKKKKTRGGEKLENQQPEGTKAVERYPSTRGRRRVGNEARRMDERRWGERSIIH